ncbi:LysR substrate-binding domain-containing protein [Kosakonia pseudosacchari]|uniref:LysR substrate-binding domain-containing protein n=1 Tax=Kosakonia pseudosacchari TaxID=1646340 RepID=UPI00188040C3|nr:LysR substrate-binding domain-containing protein [Kosakonia pseudosacchari]QOV66056.1 LysR family transcriptional regulator [Kosakonia pseudosacchari]
MNQNLPPLYALRAFTVAAQMASFSQAALFLNVTPGAVSRHIRTLEEWFGCRLFQRHGPKITLTEAGSQLAVRLQDGFLQLENACQTLRSHQHQLRLKAPSTLTMRWLLEVLAAFRQQHSTPQVEISSVWMDIDTVDFRAEPFDCAILLGNGHFGEYTQSLRLFNEWLIPLCAPALKALAQRDLSSCPLIHPSRDRRDWRRWQAGSGLFPALALGGGAVFDTLEQAYQAAIGGHGVAVGDLLLSLPALAQHQLTLPFPQAISTGDSYWLVWPKDSPRKKNIDRLGEFLCGLVPVDFPPQVELLKQR